MPMKGKPLLKPWAINLLKTKTGRRILCGQNHLKKNKINIVTLGCSKNIYDSEILMGQLKANGKEVAHEEDDGNIVVINTCGFIDNAKQESIDTILDFVEKKQSGDS